MDKKQAVRTFENKVPVIFAVVCCIAVAALSAAVRLSGAPADIPVSASASGNAAETVILDAGHPTYLNTQTPRIWLNQAV